MDLLLNLEGVTSQHNLKGLSLGRKGLGRSPPTALSLMAGASARVTCVYCDHPHSSNSCQTVTDPKERKRLLRTSGRCFVCLRRHHISRNCRSPARCSRCRGRHHTSICSNSSTRLVTGTLPSNQAAGDSHSIAGQAIQVPTTSSMCVNSPMPILLQTARAVVYDANQPRSTLSLEVRAILDLGSQRSYVTARVCEALDMRKVRSESMIIKTFGSDKEDRRTCDVVELGVVTKNGEPLTLSAVVIPHICDPVRMQPISSSKNAYEHLSGLELANSGSITGELEIDILIGSVHYWRLVTGRVLRGVSGPAAVETRLGWVLSGPVEETPSETTINFVATHTTHIP